VLIWKLSIQLLNCFITSGIHFHASQTFTVVYFMICLNVLFRATVGVNGVAKNGQVDLVSSICEQNAFHT
jgi:ABC-type uncharacterized transport system ATPase subunit